jgi:Rod binding domain-containing protein
MNVPALTPKIDASQIAPERLAHNTKLTDQQKVSEASRQFESILLKQILESSQKTVIKSKMNEDSTASGIYHDMVTTQLADSISKSGAFGLRQTFEGQLNRAHSPRPDGLAHKDGKFQSTTLKPLHQTSASLKLKPLHTDSHAQAARATTHRTTP